MPTAIAISLVVIIHIAAITLAVLALRPGRFGNALMIAVPAAAVALLMWQFGYFNGRSAPRISMASLQVEDPGQAACVKLHQELVRAGLIIDDSQPGRVVVDTALWQQVPPQLRDGIGRCLSQLAAEKDEKVEIVEVTSGAS